MASANLAHQGFDSFCPIELSDKGSKPLFGSYFFVQFDRDKDRWRSIMGTRGIKTMLGLVSERPHPLPEGIVENLQDRSELGEFDKRTLARGWVPLAPQTPIRYGYFDGIVKLDMGSRVQILYRAFGAERETTVKRNLIEVAA